MSVSDQQPAIEATRPTPRQATAQAWPVRQAAAVDNSPGHDRGVFDLRALDRQFPHEPAERPAGGGQYRSAGAGCRAARHGAGFAVAANPEKHRRPRGRHQDGTAAQAARQRRSAAGDRSRHRHAHHDGVVGDLRFLRNHAGARRPGDSGDRPRIRRRPVHRGRDRRGAAAPGDVPVFPQPAAGLAGHCDADRRRWSISLCISCSCGRCGG